MKLTVKIISTVLLITLMLSLLCFGVCAASVEVEDTETDESLGLYSILDSLTPAGALVIIIIITSVIGIVAPLAPIVVYTLKLIKKRSEFEVVDYITLAISGIWLASGILLLLTIL